MSETNAFFKSLIKGIVLALLFMVISILVFAIVIKLAKLDTDVIKVVNQFIKVISIFFGCFYSIRENKGIIKGLLTGAIAMVIMYLLFSAFNKSNLINGLWIVDVIFAGVIGAISGIIAVNLRRR